MKTKLTISGFIILTLLLCNFFVYNDISSAAQKIIKVGRGDTLRSLSKKYLGSEDKFYDLAGLNNLEPPFAIYPGLKLAVPVHTKSINLPARPVFKEKLPVQIKSEAPKETKKDVMPPVVPPVASIKKVDKDVPDFSLVKQTVLAYLNLFSLDNINKQYMEKRLVSLKELYENEALAKSQVLTKSQDLSENIPNHKAEAGLISEAVLTVEAGLTAEAGLTSEAVLTAEAVLKTQKRKKRKITTVVLVVMMLFLLIAVVRLRESYNNSRKSRSIDRMKW